MVEDDFLIGETLVEALQDQGATVVGPIGWVAEALTAIRDPASRFDVAVLDVDLHGRRSYPIADALAARGIPFVFTTGYDAGAVEPAYREHARLEKPLSATALIARLAEILRRRPDNPSLAPIKG